MRRLYPAVEPYRTGFLRVSNIHEIYFDRQAQPLEDDQVVHEWDRFERALERTAADLRALHQKVATQVGHGSDPGLCDRGNNCDRC